jgi:hypothetical protein
MTGFTESANWPTTQPTARRSWWWLERRISVKEYSWNQRGKLGITEKRAG